MTGSEKIRKTLEIRETEEKDQGRALWLFLKMKGNRDTPRLWGQSQGRLEMTRNDN